VTRCPSCSQNAHEECARSMRAVKASLDGSLNERVEMMANIYWIVFL
jgi:hypothetical protein